MPTNRYWIASDYDTARPDRAAASAAWEGYHAKVEMTGGRAPVRWSVTGYHPETNDRDHVFASGEEGSIEAAMIAAETAAHREYMAGKEQECAHAGWYQLMHQASEKRNTTNGVRKRR